MKTDINVKKRAKFWTAVAITLLPLAALGIAYQPVVVEGRSMLPTLHHRQVVLMERHVSGPLYRGDVVVFEMDGEMMIKRVYAVAGDSLELIVAPNGASMLLATSDLASRRFREYATRSWDVRLARVRVPEGHVYVLGDNYRESGDSREFGAIPEDQIMGRVLPARQAVRRLPANLLASLPRAHARQSRRR